MSTIELNLKSKDSTIVQMKSKDNNLKHFYGILTEGGAFWLKRG